MCSICGKPVAAGTTAHGLCIPTPVYHTVEEAIIRAVRRKGNGYSYLLGRYV